MKKHIILTWLRYLKFILRLINDKLLEILKNVEKFDFFNLFCNVYTYNDFHAIKQNDLLKNVNFFRATYVCIQPIESHCYVLLYYSRMWLI